MASAARCVQARLRRAYLLFDVSSLHTISCIDNIYDLDVEAAEHQQIVRSPLHISLDLRNLRNDKRYDVVIPSQTRATLIMYD